MDPALIVNNGDPVNARSPDSDEQLIARLTTGEKDCLRFVREQLTSKEIGQRLGISPHTVDRRLKNAMAKLRVQSRRDAALALVAQEGDQRLVYQPSALPPAEPLPETAVLEDAAGTVKPGWDMAIEPPCRPAPAASETEDGHGLSIAAQLGLIVVLAILAALAFGALVAGLHTLTEIARGR